MYWGVSHSRSLKSYKENLDGVYTAVPRILDLFTKYNISATWATVGMIMCENYNEWKELLPEKLPNYSKLTSPYDLDLLVRENPKYFFALPLVKKILNTSRQEIACHTYSHLCCGEEGITIDHFLSDIKCAISIAEKKNIELKSIVLPRNQVIKKYLTHLNEFGINVYRGNPKNFLYVNGHNARGWFFSRIIRVIDHYFPITNPLGNVSEEIGTKLTNCPATIFLRPYTKRLSFLEPMKIRRIKNLMTKAAISKKNFHLWFHPHNFGVNIDQNILNLEKVLLHYKYLSEKYGMNNISMNSYSK